MYARQEEKKFTEQRVIICGWWGYKCLGFSFLYFAMFSKDSAVNALHLTIRKTLMLFKTWTARSTQQQKPHLLGSGLPPEASWHSQNFLCFYLLVICFKFDNVKVKGHELEFRLFVNKYKIKGARAQQWVNWNNYKCRLCFLTFVNKMASHL